MKERLALPVLVPDPRCFAVGAALRWELEAVLGALRRCGAVNDVGGGCWRGAAGAIDVHVYRTGVGMRAARRSTTRLLRRIPASLVLNTGCAGALTDDWRAGDLAVATSVVGPPPTCTRWEVAAATRDMFCEIAAARPPRPARLATSTSPLLDEERKRACAAALGADVVDMEGAGVAAAAQLCGRVFASVRVVLDPLRPGLPARALPLAQRPPGRTTPADEVHRAAALYAHEQQARESLAAFYKALFAALPSGIIDPPLERLR